MEIEPTDENHEKNESIKPLEDSGTNLEIEPTDENHEKNESTDVSDAEATEKEAPSDRMNGYPCSKCDFKTTWSSDIERHVKTNHEDAAQEVINDKQEIRRPENLEGMMLKLLKKRPLPTEQQG